MTGRAHTVRATAAAWARRGADVATAAAAAVVLLVTGTAPGHAEAPARTSAQAGPEAVRAGGTLRCSLRTAPGITLSPAVSGTPRRVSARGTVHLSGCVSPDGKQSRIRSGRLALSGSGLANCSGATGVKGSGTITWYAGANRTGGVVGRSVVRPASGGRQGYTPLDSFLGGRVTSGLMAGRSFSGTAVPTNDVRTCLTRGLGRVEGRGRLGVG
ncbi:hypothetical protein ACH4U6_32545 [Streptomyces netropsis]|uniref:hypothetical protein n=1 Tax=Streptomyces netropsis TaxID=55404 RepID=UPI00378AB343